MSDLTIPAQLVAEGVGLPAVWRYCDGERSRYWHLTSEVRRWPGQLVDLSDPQTAFGVALKLDAWERARDPNWYDRSTWADRLLDHWQHGEADPRPDMIARLTHVGQDAAIRRALGWTVEAGTLALLFRTSAGEWVIMCPKSASQRRFRFDLFPEVHAATTEPEARAAIYAALREATCG